MMTIRYKSLNQRRCFHMQTKDQEFHRANKSHGEIQRPQTCVVDPNSDISFVSRIGLLSRDDDRVLFSGCFDLRRSSSKNRN